ncbi:lysine transporter LysE [Clostridiales bacterium PH28_bin88]|nr:lysine transporter LysE [Clostridiales bacterium PH28_bin88]
MEVGFLLRGIALGFLIAAPVGPVGILCIRRALVEGRSYGFVSGLGAATADAVYGCVAGLGLTIISNFMISHQIWLRLAGGLFLCFLGFTTLKSRPAKEAAPVKGKGLFGAYVSTFFVTITNPMTILSFTAIFAGMGVASTGGNYASAGALIAGVFLGSTSWWLLLSSFVSLFQTKFNLQGMKWVNKISGMTIFVFGVIALMTVLK